MKILCPLCHVNEVSSTSERAWCDKCRSHMGRWRKRRAAEILKRRENLKVYSVRMEVLADVPKSGAIIGPPKENNVLPFKPKKKA